MQDYKSKNKKLLIRTLGEIVRERRLKSGKSIYAIAAECGLSKSTWREVEVCACNNINLTTLWQIADGLELPIDVLVKELKQKLGNDFSILDE